MWECLQKVRWGRRAVNIFAACRWRASVCWERLAGGLGVGSEAEAFYPELEPSHADGEKGQWHAGAQEQALTARVP